MKKLILAIMLTAIGAVAQTNTTTTFYQSVMGYFSSFNTNLLTFQTNHHADIWLGMDTVENTKIAASFNVSADLYKGFDLRGTVRNDTILGKVFAAQAGVGYGFVTYDTKISGFVEFGKRFDFNQAYAAPGIEVKKALTDNTYAGVGMELPLYFTKGSNPNGTSVTSPTFSVFTGFKF